MQLNTLVAYTIFRMQIGHVEELSATTVFEQEKGAMHGFNLARSPQKNTSSGLGRSELKEHGYLLSEDAKQRLGEQGMNYRTVDDPMSPASRLLG